MTKGKGWRDYSQCIIVQLTTPINGSLWKKVSIISALVLHILPRNKKTKNLKPEEILDFFFALPHAKIALPPLFSLACLS
jgi:hypothetical protein